MAAMLDLWLPVSSHSVGHNSIEKFDPENGGVAVGISFLSHLEVEICLGEILPPRLPCEGVKKGLPYEG